MCARSIVVFFFVLDAAALAKSSERSKRVGGRAFENTLARLPAWASQSFSDDSSTQASQTGMTILHAHLGNVCPLNRCFVFVLHAATLAKSSERSNANVMKRRVL